MRVRKHTARERRALRAALNFAHEQGYDSRRDYLPVGQIASPDQCPLAKACGRGLVSSSILWSSPSSVDLPPLVAEFVELYDKGRYPELVG